MKPALAELDTLITPLPAVLALGEPVHGVEDFPLLRNEILRHIVARGFRSIALETDYFAAGRINDHVQGTTDLDDLETGFSHHFGRLPSNRELVEWLRAHNATRPPEDRVSFHGFDAPTEFAAAPSPRAALNGVRDFLEAAPEFDDLVGDEADWTNPAAMYDPAASIGRSDRVKALKAIADDLAAATKHLTRKPGYVRAAAHARTAQDLLRYHAAMAGDGPERMNELLAIRAEMMAANLLEIAEHHGPTFVFAHNAHVLRTRSVLSMSDVEATWSSAGALVAERLGERYVVVAADATVSPEPGTLQGELAKTGRTLFLEPAGTLPAGAPIARGHLPLKPGDLDGADALIFLTGTDGTQLEFW